VLGEGTAHDLHAVAALTSRQPHKTIYIQLTGVAARSRLGMSARDRVRVLLSLMGGQTSVLIHERDLAPAGVSAFLGRT
jgi:hypothetical protein